MLTENLQKQLRDSGYTDEFDLSSLVEACGERIHTIRKAGTNGNEIIWSAWEDQAYGGPRGKTGYGSTPEEAVARLWLELNEEQKDEDWSNHVKEMGDLGVIVD